MKTQISLATILALALGLMPFTGGCAQTTAQTAVVTNNVETKAGATSPTSPAPIPLPATNLTASMIQTAVEPAEPAAAAEKPTPVKPAVEEPPPANLKVSPALREVLKMVKAGVGKDVLAAFVNESKERFALGPEEIIYLSDLGLADEVTTAMIERDRVLRGEAEPATSPVPPPVVATESTPAAENPALYAPQYQAAEASSAPVAQPEPVQTAVTPDSDATYFYDSLAPYGNWVNVPSYGLCWQPTAVVTTPTWRPYLDCGRWVWSDCGWYWLSDYSWGWAPFHYGRWFYHGSHGWVWRPGRTWGPAWVSWRNSDEYCGWAPLPPEAGFVTSLGLTWRGGGVSWDFEFGLGWSSYCFVPVSTFCDYSPRRYVVHHDRSHEIWQHTKVVNKIKIKGDNNTVVLDGNGRNRVRVKGDNNTVIFEGGANPERVETASRAPVRRVHIRDAEGDPSKGRRPDRIEREGSEFVVYRPELPARASDRARSAVARVAAQPERSPDRIRNDIGRSERAPNNLKAVDARYNWADSRRATSVAVAPPAPAPAPAPDSARPNPSSGRLRERETGIAGGRPASRVAETTRSRDAARESTAVTRTSDSLIIRGNNTTPARNATAPTVSRMSTPEQARVAPTPAAPVARVDRPRVPEQSNIERENRSGDSRSIRSAPVANAAARTATPTPVTRATPITQPYRIERVEPIRVWNSTPAQTTQPIQPIQPVQPAQRYENRNINPALSAPIRGYTPVPASSPSVENYRQDRNSGRNEDRIDRAPVVNAPSYRAPAPAPVPAYSAPERSRSEAVRAERERGGDNNNTRSSGGGGGGGGGGRNNGNDGGGNRSGRNR